MAQSLPRWHDPTVMPLLLSYSYRGMIVVTPNAGSRPAAYPRCVADDRHYRILNAAGCILQIATLSQRDVAAARVVAAEASRPRLGCSS